MADARRTLSLLAGFAVVWLGTAPLRAQDPRAGRQQGTRREPPPRLATTRVAPDAYGTTDYTVTTISGTSLIPFDPDDTYDTTLCCLSRGFLDGQGEFYASVNIPAGAIIDFIGVESYATCPGIVGLELWEQTHGSTSGIAGISSTVHGYDTDYNVTPINYQVGMNAHKALAVQVETLNSCPNYSAVSWVEIWWRRVVSDPPGSPSFADVPASDFGYQYIEALKASGITGGCTETTFCPDNPVTRRQMAIFIAKALGLHWPF
jgi:hypothetical protein